MNRTARALSLVLLSALALASCGLAPEVPTPPPVPTPSPTSTPLPTAEPATPAPALEQVTIDSLETYSDPAGLFSLSVPAGWQRRDRSTAEARLLTWTDPAENALIIVSVTEAPAGLPPAELRARLTTFVETFQGQQDFAMDPPEELQGGVQIVWSYTAQATGGVEARLLANSFISQDGDKLSVLTFGVPEEQLDRLREPLDQMRDSYRVEPSVALSPADDIDRVEFDFAEAAGGWVTDDTAELRAAVEGGVYRITLRTTNSYYLSAPSLAPVDDTTVSGIVLVEGNARAGLALRLSQDADGRKTYYACWIDATDLFGCFVSVADQWTTLLEPATSPAIRPGAANSLTLTAVDDTITFAVNGTELARLTDARVAEGGPAVYLENFDTEAGAAFDDIAVVTPR